MASLTSARSAVAAPGRKAAIRISKAACNSRTRLRRSSNPIMAQASRPGHVVNAVSVEVETEQRLTTQIETVTLNSLSMLPSGQPGQGTAFGAALRGRPEPLGATVDQETEGINLAIFSSNATGMSLVLFTEDDLEAGLTTFEIPLDPVKNKSGDVWHILLPGLNTSLLYGFRVAGDHQDTLTEAAGQRFSEAHVVLDPYTRGIISRRQYGKLARELPYGTQNVLGLAQTWPQHGGVLPQRDDQFDWEGDRPLNIPMEDLIIYEMHVRGFTQDPSSRVVAPGTYAGMIEKLDYLKNLGVNAIEMLPIFEFNELEYYAPIPGSVPTEYRHNFWGYSTIGFFAPMSRSQGVRHPQTTSIHTRCFPQPTPHQHPSTSLQHLHSPFRPHLRSRTPCRSSIRCQAVPSPQSPKAIQPPHSGYHFDGSDRRFFEGWYFKVTDPFTNQSFAIIFSVEDPARPTAVSGVGAQVMGLDDGYMVQFEKTTNNFWAARNDLELGCVFNTNTPGRALPKRMMGRDQFEREVQHGFQSSLTFHQGKLIDTEAAVPGGSLSTVKSCSWEFTVKPVYGWGDGKGGTQQPTAGWLSAFSVFEPHWQVLMAHGLATGWFQWGEQRLEFKDAPSYGEKNWGAGFPSKWCWIQCNSFDQQPNLSITAVGARRGLLNLPGFEEDVGMIGIHYNDEFIQLVPWTGQVEWTVDPWGSWYLWAENDEYEAVVEATTAVPGQMLRAPTSTQGLYPVCKDTFQGACNLKLWKKTPTKQLVVEANSPSAALETGGGFPWEGTWSTRAEMKEPLKSMVQLPVDLGAVIQCTPGFLRPPGL